MPSTPPPTISFPSLSCTQSFIDHKNDLPETSLTKYKARRRWRRRGRRRRGRWKRRSLGSKVVASLSLPPPPPPTHPPHRKPCRIGRDLFTPTTPGPAPSSPNSTLNHPAPVMEEAAVVEGAEIYEFYLGSSLARPSGFNWPPQTSNTLNIFKQIFKRPTFH